MKSNPYNQTVFSALNPLSFPSSTVPIWAVLRAIFTRQLSSHPSAGSRAAAPQPAATGAFSLFYFLLSSIKVLFAYVLFLPPVVRFFLLPVEC